jgi:hypothetical protein
MGLERFLYFKPPEYAYAWNCMAAGHTANQLGDVVLDQVDEMYLAVIHARGCNFVAETSVAVKYQAYWLSQTLLALGIAPLLGSRRAKWYHVPNPDAAHKILLNTSGVWTEVVMTITREYGVDPTVGFTAFMEKTAI